VARYGDETTTGRVFRRKGGTKATVAARAEDPGGFEWWLGWKRDFLQEVPDPDSDLVLRITQVDPRAAERLLRGVSPCPVFIVDFSENTERLLAPLKRVAPHLFPAGQDPMRVITSAPQLRGMAEGILGMLRERAIEQSAIGGVERLLQDDGGFGSALRRAGLDHLMGTRSDATVFDRRALLEMNEGEFRTLAARFAVLLGDALSLNAQAEALTEEMKQTRYFMGAHVAHRVIGAALGQDYVFDVAGSRRVTLALDEAHATIERFLRNSARHFLDITLTGGLEERDSRSVLGIQVADVAAAVAADLFERSRKPALDSARELRDQFDRVFLNGRWIA
jgi:hypothetical protein